MTNNSLKELETAEVEWLTMFKSKHLRWVLPVMGKKAAEKQLFVGRNKMAYVLDNFLFKDAVVYLRRNITPLRSQGEQLEKQISWLYDWSDSWAIRSVYKGGPGGSVS